ncbi:MAG TPA: PIG-L family deacetylase [Gemmatimonadaceae bacterium]|nr:PIG-L family deacetylase [Gemmatimonadaceae bacterium]
MRLFSSVSRWSCLIGLLPIVGWEASPVARYPSPVTRYPLPVSARTAGSVRYVSNSASVLDVVLVAHQDDWQLFMGDVVAKRVRTGTPAVFIYLTAGDDGRDSLYWTTRERGALESTRVATAAAADTAFGQCSTTRALEHLIRKCTLGNTESYFLRLPDGRRDGMGFASHSYQSLRKLRGNRITSMSALDGSTTYNGWADLLTTVATLVGEGSADRTVTIHTSDPSVVVNPHDHFDHRMAGLLVAESRRQHRWSVVYYTGYALDSRAANRSRDQARQKVALFQAYDAVMTRTNPGWSAYREHPAFYSECMLRTYGRKIARR